MKHIVTLADGRIVPALGQGTWYLGDSAATHDREVEALRRGVEAGMTLIDTAEMYGGGRSERMVGDAIAGMRRDGLFLVSKVLPSNAGRRDIFHSCDETLRRLGTDYLDLYLLHWRGNVPLAETVECMERLVRDGKIRAWGVSNFDTDDMEELWRIPEGRHCLVNQVLYNPSSRGIEYDLLGWMNGHDVKLMAYCPIAQAGTLRRGLFDSPQLIEVARHHHATVPQVILAWDIRNGNTIAIPRTGKSAHTLENAQADAITLSDEDLALIDQAWPAPNHKVPLDME